MVKEEKVVESMVVAEVVVMAREKAETCRMHGPHPPAYYLSKKSGSFLLMLGLHVMILKRLLTTCDMVEEEGGGSEVSGNNVVHEGGGGGGGGGGESGLHPCIHAHPHLNWLQQGC
jgi:hypothetical protein